MPGFPVPTIILLGLRASGKTTVGRLLAARLGRVFVDLDDRTAAALGAASAGAALARHGEAAFRLAEAGALGAALGEGPMVLALGGGTPTAPGAEALLKRGREAGKIRVVYLRASASELRSRLAGDATVRPSLTGRGTMDEVEELLAARDPLYRGLADVVIEAGEGGAEEVVRRVLDGAGTYEDPPRRGGVP
jgi:shikimate kinase